MMLSSSSMSQHVSVFCFLIQLSNFYCMNIPILFIFSSVHWIWFFFLLIEMMNFCYQHSCMSFYVDIGFHSSLAYSQQNPWFIWQLWFLKFFKVDIIFYISIIVNTWGFFPFPFLRQLSLHRPGWSQTHYNVLHGLKITTVLPQSPKCWIYYFFLT